MPQDVPKIIDFDASTYKATMGDAIGIGSWTDNILGTTGLKIPFRMIEVGCGSGKFSACFKNRGCHALATDANPDMLKRVSLNFPNLKIETRVVALPEVPGDIRDYDLAFNEGLVEHFPPDEAVEIVQSMASVLKPGGWVAIYIPVDTQERGEYPYTVEEMVRVFSKVGLNEIVTWYIFWTNSQGKQKRHLGCVGRKP